MLGLGRARVESDGARHGIETALDEPWDDAARSLGCAFAEVIGECRWKDCARFLAELASLC